MNLYQYVNFATRNERIARAFGTAITSNDPQQQTNSLIDTVGLQGQQVLNAKKRGLLLENDTELPSRSQVVDNFLNRRGWLDTSGRDNATVSTMLQTGKNMSFPERKAWRTRMYENNRARKAMGMDNYDQPVNSYKYDSNYMRTPYGEQDYRQRELSGDKMREAAKQGFDAIHANEGYTTNLEFKERYPEVWEEMI